MDEEEGVTGEADPHPGARETDSFGFQSFEEDRQTGSAEGEVVDSLAAPGDEAGHRASLPETFQKFDPAIADRDHRGANRFGRNGFDGGYLETECFEAFGGQLEGVYGDGYVVQFWALEGEA